MSRMIAFFAVCACLPGLAPGQLSRSGSSSFPLDPDTFDSVQFERNLRDELRDFNRSLALASLTLMRSRSSAPGRTEQIQATYEFLDQGVERLSAGYPQLAIDQYFDPLLDAFEDMLAEQPLATYVARSDKEGMYYILTAASRDQNVQAIGSYGADVYYWKALALTLLDEREGAEASLARALELSPAHSWFLSQKAQWQKNDRHWLEALATFELAANYARLLTPADERSVELGFALRGRAYVLVELGRLEEAATQYKECLELNSDDTEAQTELAYVQELLKRRGR